MNLIVGHDGWQQALARFRQADFYHTWQYHQLEAQRTGSQPHLFEYGERNTWVAIPLLIRDGRVDGCAFRDAGSVYGYAGPLINGDISDADGFFGELRESLRELGVVSVFARLHPLIDTVAVPAGAGNISTAGRTVSISLEKTRDEQWRAYRGNLRREVTALRDRGLHCEFGGTDRDIERFCAMYRATMKRRDAADDYLFSDDYISGLIRADDFDIRLWLCRHGGDVVCAGLFSLHNGIVQYHLSATDDNFRELAPTKLMLDDVRLWANEIEAKVFHLGGGIGSANDSLFRFKNGFANQGHDFQVWRWVLDESRYSKLTALYDRQLAEDDNNCADPEYFPYYRAPTRRNEGHKA